MDDSSLRSEHVRSAVEKIQVNFTIKIHNFMIIYFFGLDFVGCFSSEAASSGKTTGISFLGDPARFSERTSSRSRSLWLSAALTLKSTGYSSSIS